MSEEGRMMKDESASTALRGQRSAIGKLLDMLIKHGTMPNVPIPNWIIDAQTELARLQRIEAAARELISCHKGKLDHICATQRHALASALNESESK